MEGGVQEDDGIAARAVRAAVRREAGGEIRIKSRSRIRTGRGAEFVEGLGVEGVVGVGDEGEAGGGEGVAEGLVRGLMMVARIRAAAGPRASSLARAAGSYSARKWRERAANSASESFAM